VTIGIKAYMYMCRLADDVVSGGVRKRGTRSRMSLISLRLSSVRVLHWKANVESEKADVCN
jgi:hypothetical protein